VDYMNHQNMNIKLKWYAPRNIYLSIYLSIYLLRIFSMSHKSLSVVLPVIAGFKFPTML